MSRRLKILSGSVGLPNRNAQWSVGASTALLAFAALVCSENFLKYSLYELTKNLNKTKFIIQNVAGYIKN